VNDTLRWRIIGVESWNKTVALGGRLARCEVRPTTAGDFLWRVAFPDGLGPATSTGGIAPNIKTAKLRATHSAKSNLAYRARGPS
jgi:hypothetical protein